MKTHFKTIGRIVAVLFGIYVVLSILPYIRISPTKTEVENFLEVNSCSPTTTKTDYYDEHYCAYYLRRHTMLFFGNIIKVPTSSFLFIHTPFHYFNYIEPDTFEPHTYVLVVTRDYGTLVYNPVNGEYVGSFDALLQEVKNG